MQVILPSPVLLENELEAIRTKTGLKNRTLSLHYKSGRTGALADALHQLCQDAEAAVKNGCEVLILSDRLQGEELDPDMPPIPTLLGVGSVHHHLIRHPPPPLSLLGLVMLPRLCLHNARACRGEVLGKAGKGCRSESERHRI